MAKFETKQLPDDPDVVAPDGSDVRILLGLKGGGMAHFELQPGQTARAVTHRTVEEIWYFIAGQGEMWRENEGVAETVDVFPSVCITIPLGTRFQLRCTGHDALEAIGVTMPPWPGEDEAMLVEGPWQPSVGTDPESGG
ncbi:MAG TPA: cupin domain-containing protein [Terriglobia bacterium]|nr:cupin domain-containing protein [Terriglobia bacterium]